MTNFEWLCKENKLVEFLKDVSEEWCDVCEHWHIPRCEDDDDYELNIANWLQAERKVTKWVRLDDMLNVLNAYKVHLKENIKLETREIEDD